ncbi:3'-5' exonuclease domain-containing protein [Caenorhabditis elegans]|uniref:3'-5' exonuclease domain-containing protein n=1 Tax=Caenorhabditis elegans TaxID=6239 RepID=Q9XUL8_CAEEL|nr:3'-5' exonuclease domain-containing protein [Caenorhabditis elegans]CAB04908.2 3'-5' exonuclease domain-containing protein [Caenorhabditis elegans]|eukprot:NP_493422.2 Uncharacterized protein CELE_W04A8.4 [Caenorhabditis elegans]
MVSYGKEDFLADIEHKDMQSKFVRTNGTRSLLSLKAEATYWTGLDLHKGETMSDWTNTHLRGDQLRYAIMDTIVMHLIIKQRLRNIHKNDPRLFQYVFENGHPLPYNR